MTSSAELLVLGAGPAGLAAAWRAARAGLSVTVLERASAVGGLAASFTVAGVRVDHGSHRLHPSIGPDILADLRGLVGDDLQTRPRNGRLRVAGRWVGFPLRAGELARTLPPGMLARIAGDAATGLAARALPAREPASYAEVLRRGLGGTVYDALYGPYAVKLWGLPGERIDPEQARRRVATDTPAKIAAKMLRRGGQVPGKSYYYPRRGFGQICEALADAATVAGARIRCDTAVTRLEAREDGVTAETGTGERLFADRVFTTVPLPLLARITDPAPEPAALTSAAALQHRSMVLVYLVHEGAGRWTGFDAHYLPGGETPITRISEPANYRDSAADPSDRTVLCCEIPCSVDDAWWPASEHELAELARDTLARAGLPPVRLGEVVVRRLRTVYPVYEIGYAEHLSGLDTWAAALPRVTTFGRQGLFVHDNTHHTFSMAYAAVDALAGSWDEVAWSAARRRFAEHVVED